MPGYAAWVSPANARVWSELGRGWPGFARNRREFDRKPDSGMLIPIAGVSRKRWIGLTGELTPPREVVFSIFNGLRMIYAQAHGYAGKGVWVSA